MFSGCSVCHWLDGGGGARLGRRCGGKVGLQRALPIAVRRRWRVCMPASVAEEVVGMYCPLLGGQVLVAAVLCRGWLVGGGSIEEES